MTGSKPGGTGPKGGDKAGESEKKSSSAPSDPPARSPAALAVTSKVNAPEEDGPEATGDPGAGDSRPPHPNPELAKLAALLAEDRAALGRLRDRDRDRERDERAYSSEATAFDALEITAVAGPDSGPNERDLLEFEEPSGPSQTIPGPEGEFDRLEVTAVGESGRDVLSPRTIESTATRPPPGGRPKRLTPGGQRIAALLAQKRAKTGKHELLDAQSADKAPAGNVPGGGAQPAVSAAMKDSTSGKTPGLSSTLLGISAPDVSLLRSSEQTGRPVGPGQSGRIAPGPGRGIGFSLADEAELTERNTAAPSYAAAGGASGRFEISDQAMKRPPRGAIWIVGATALAVLAVGVIISSRSRKTAGHGPPAPVAAPAPPTPTVVQMPPSAPATGAPSVSEGEGEGSPQRPSNAAPATGATPPLVPAPSEQPAPPAAVGAGASSETGGQARSSDEAPARDDPSEGRDESAGTSSAEVSSTDSKRKSRHSESRRAESRRAKRKAKAAKNGSQRVLASPPDASSPTTDRAKTKAAGPVREDPDATLPLTGR